MALSRLAVTGSSRKCAAKLAPSVFAPLPWRVGAPQVCVSLAVLPARPGAPRVWRTPLMWKWVHRLRHLGTREDMDPRLARRVVLMNTIVLTLCLVTWPYVVVFAVGGSSPLAVTCAVGVML